MMTIDPVSELAYLQTATAPMQDRRGTPFRIVDLFSGCGGMSLGVARAAQELGRRLDIRLAIDLAQEASQVYRANLGTFVRGRAGERITCSDVKRHFDPDALGRSLRAAELRTTSLVGKARVDLLMGGPPCQGHSDLNNHTRRMDPRNSLYLCMARAAEVLKPRYVVIENVPQVRNAHDAVVQRTVDVLEGVYGKHNVLDDVIDLAPLGLAQRRRRHLLIAGLSDPTAILHDLAARPGMPLTVREAIGDLARRNGTAFDTPSKCSPENQRRIAWLFDNREHDLPDSERPPCHRLKPHSYNSVYGRLHGDRPSQTITTGFGSMGQGRYVHFSRRRTITPHEAARLQGFPDWFRFDVVSQRGAWSRLIGNAVPPLMTYRIAAILMAGKRQGSWS